MSFCETIRDLISTLLFKKFIRFKDATVFCLFPKFNGSGWNFSTFPE